MTGVWKYRGVKGGGKQLCGRIGNQLIFFRLKDHTGDMNAANKSSGEADLPQKIPEIGGPAQVKPEVPGGLDAAGPPHVKACLIFGIYKTQGDPEPIDGSFWTDKRL